VPHSEAVKEALPQPLGEKDAVPVALTESVADSVPLWQLLPLLEYVALAV
jgi:hypothetical protein